MRILFDLTGLYDHITGVERYAMEIAEAFICQYPEHKYILIFKNEIHNRFKDICGMENVEPVIIKGKGRFVTGQIKLTLCLYKHKADAYVFLAFPEPLLFFSKKIYTAVHDMTPWEKGDTMKTFSKWYYRISHIHSVLFSKYVLTISRFSAERIRRILHVPYGKIKLIRCGVSSMLVNTDDIYEKYKIPTGNEYFMTLSTVEPRKRLPLLLEAYEKLLSDKTNDDFPELVIAGRKGWKIESLMAGYSEELKKHVHFTGFVDEEDMGSLYNNAKFFVFPSEYEGFGLPPLEAMSKGCLVLSSNAASMPEVLGKAAVYFKSGNVNNLTEKLKIVNKISLGNRDKYIEAGYLRAKKFSWRKEAAKLEKILKR